MCPEFGETARLWEAARGLRAGGSAPFHAGGPFCLEQWKVWERQWGGEGRLHIMNVINAMSCILKMVNMTNCVIYIFTK